LLVLRLQEYKKIKDAAYEINNRDMLGRDVFKRGEVIEEKPKGPEEPVFDEVTLFSLIEAFRDVLDRTKEEFKLHVVPEPDRIEDKLDNMLTLLSREKEIYFHDIFLPGAKRLEIIVSFIALLELVRLKALRIVQANRDGGILCQVTELFEAGETDWKAMILGEIYGENNEPLKSDPVEEDDPSQEKFDF